MFLCAGCLQTPKKGSIDFQKLLEDAMNVGDAAAFAGLQLPPIYCIITVAAVWQYPKKIAGRA